MHLLAMYVVGCLLVSLAEGVAGALLIFFPHLFKFSDVAYC